jgi:methyl-accepting chemotaxis protein
MDQISSTIATAVEEQSATMSEMSRNLTEVAKGRAMWRRTSAGFRRRRKMTGGFAESGAGVGAHVDGS